MNPVSRVLSPRTLLILLAAGLFALAGAAAAQDHDAHGHDTHAATETAEHAADEHGDAHGDAHAMEAHGDHHVSPVGQLPLWTVIPFVGILLSIALGPLVAPHFWHHHFPKVSAFWALLFAIPFLFWNVKLGIQEILHIYLIDYVPFIILLWGLFTVSGGPVDVTSALGKSNALKIPPYSS